MRPRTPARDDHDPLVIDTAVAHEARVYDHLLGGKDNFEVDRKAAEAHGRAVGGIENSRHAVGANRRFLGRAVRYLVSEGGVRQFLDLGSGIPTCENVHQVAQRGAPESRVVYVDYDPIVMAHAHTLSNGTAEGDAAYVLADMRDIDRILAKAAGTLDLSRPVAVMFMSMLHFFGDAEDPHATVRQYLDGLTPGSFLVISHMAADIQAEAITALAESTARDDSIDYEFHPRTRVEVLRFFDGLELIDPGVVQIDEWRPDGSAPPPPPGAGDPPFHAGVGRKP